MINHSPGDGPATVLVHGVRRIAGGTVVYYSLSPAPGGYSKAGIISFSGLSTTLAYAGYTGQVLLLDSLHARAYAPLKDAGGRGITTQGLYTGSFARDGFYVYQAVMPELPAELTTIDVRIGDVAVIPAVRVESGLLEPAVTSRNPVPLGSGWPEVDQAAVAAAVDPAGSVLPMEVVVSTLDESVTTREQPGSVTVDLAADVLFDVDSAALTSGAAAQVQAAATAIDSRAAGGVVSIVGHTDATGSTAHNADLSRRRAAAVAAALEPLVTAEGISYTVAGRGESEPVATNGTQAGRQANRRVSVTFAVKAG